jgi:hypothetical protein
MAKGDPADNPFEKGDKKDADEKKETTSKYLTKANWTPDILASILATNGGLLLGGILAMLLPFVHGTAVYVFTVVLVLGTSWSLAHMCYHMELEGHRFYQQGYFFLAPLLAAFVATAVIIVVTTRLTGSFVSSFTTDNPMIGVALPEIGDAGGALNTVSAGISFGAIGILTFIYTIATLLPFSVMAARHKWLKWYYLLWALPAVIVGILLLQLGALVPA